MGTMTRRDRAQAYWSLRKMAIGFRDEAKLHNRGSAERVHLDGLARETFARAAALVRGAA